MKWEINETRTHDTSWHVMTQGSWIWSHGNDLWKQVKSQKIPVVSCWHLSEQMLQKRCIWKLRCQSEQCIWKLAPRPKHSASPQAARKRKLFVKPNSVIRGIRAHSFSRSKASMCCNSPCAFPRFLLHNRFFRLSNITWMLSYVSYGFMLF